MMKPANTSKPCSTASTLSKEQRKALAIRVIENKQTVTDAAKQHGVSRKFIHELKNKAIEDDR